MRPVMLALAATLLATPAGAVGFQFRTAPDADGTPLELAIWYPSDAPHSVHNFGPFALDVAFNAPLTGHDLPLVVISHGTGGLDLTQNDTAAALADSGFVVAAVTHAGDNYKDQSKSFTMENAPNRARQISHVIDYMLGGWDAHAAINPARIGMFGHSAGGLTGLLLIGGVGEWARAISYCTAHPDDWGCVHAHQAGVGSPASGRLAGDEPRIKAAVLAAPAMVHIFGTDGLHGVDRPVQLWVGAEDTIVPDAITARDRLPTEPDFHAVPKAGHFAFLAPCSEQLAKVAPEICTDRPGFDRVAFHQEFNNAVISFFQTHLAASR